MCSEDPNGLWIEHGKGWMLCLRLPSELSALQSALARLGRAGGLGGIGQASENCAVLLGTFVSGLRCDKHSRRSLGGTEQQQGRPG